MLSRLPLDEAGLLAVQAYEQAHQGRVTVLRGVERTLNERLAEPVERRSRATIQITTQGTRSAKVPNSA